MKSVPQKKFPHIEQELLKKPYVFVLVHGEDAAGQAMYFYLAVESERWDEFKRALTTDYFDAKNFGKVLYSDYGSGPTETVTSTVEEYYGITLDNIAAVQLP